MTELVRSDRENIVMDRETMRICAPCHNKDLNEFNLVFERVFIDELYGDVEMWRCEECNQVDYWIPEKQMWTRDYEWLHNEMVDAFGEE